VLVGLLIGTVGVGGVLMVAYLALFTTLGIHGAAATSLFSFLFTGLLVAIPVCAGAVVGYFGASAAALVEPRPLGIIIALIIIAAGLYLLVPLRTGARHRDGSSGSAEQILLSVVGGASGFGSGFSGAGGPLFSVPIMVMMGYVPLTAVATSQVLQIVAATSGSLGNWRHGFIDFEVAFVIIAFELVGVLAGVRLAHVVQRGVVEHAAGWQRPRDLELRERGLGLFGEITVYRSGVEAQLMQLRLDLLQEAGVGPPGGERRHGVRNRFLGMVHRRPGGCHRRRLDEQCGRC
jgi:uncharacterized membrane protein YfcA